MNVFKIVSVRLQMVGKNSSNYTSHQKCVPRLSGRGIRRGSPASGSHHRDVSSQKHGQFHHQGQRQAFASTGLNAQGIRHGQVTISLADTSPKEMVYAATMRDDVVARRGEILLVLNGGKGYPVTDDPAASRASVMVRDDDSPPAPTSSVVRVGLGVAGGQSLFLSENREGFGNNFTILGFTVRFSTKAWRK